MMGSLATQAGEMPAWRGDHTGEFTGRRARGPIWAMGGARAGWVRLPRMGGEVTLSSEGGPPLGPE